MIMYIVMYNYQLGLIPTMRRKKVVFIKALTYTNGFFSICKYFGKIHF